MDEDDLERLLSSVETSLGREWRGTVEWINEQNPVEGIAARIESGAGVALAVEGIEDAAARFAAEVADGYLISGQKVAKWIDKQLDDKLVTFEATNIRAVDWARANRLQIGGSITYEAREVVRNVIADGVNAGLNPRAIARDIRDSIGLTDHQRQHVASYRRALEQGDFANALSRELRDGRHDKALRRALAGDDALTPAQIDKMVARYHRNYVAFRAETIARTEALRAVHQGADEAFSQAVDLGQLDGDRIEYTWLAGSAPRTRDWHSSMRGQKRARGVPFVSGHGVLLMHPGDPSAPSSEIANCRCKRAARIKPAEQFLAAAA